MDAKNTTKLFNVPITVSNPLLNFKNHTLVAQTSHFPKRKRKHQKKVHVFGKSVCKRRRKYEVSRTKIMDLPRVIMVEILSRLPIKSIFRVKMVCTNYDYVSCPRNRPIELSTEFHLPDLRVEGVNFWGEHYSRFNSTLIGSCYGFISILVGDSWHENQFVYICNPLLGEYVKLSLPKWEKRNRSAVYGFCSSQASGKYIVLRSVLKKYRGRPEVTELEVYTLGVDEKWRILGEGPFPRMGSFVTLRRTFGDVTVNGALHWINDDDPHAMANIYSFDIGTEKVKPLPAPPGLETPSWCLGLAKLGDKLCLSDSRKSKHLDIWWMKEYGISESWVKDRISMSSIRPDILHQICIPIIIWKDGEILLQNGSRTGEFISYNPKEKFFRKVNVYGGGTSVTAYIPSFYSLKTVVGNNFEISNVYPEIQIV
ncbi:F-box protein At3g07870-like [Lycium barbarum]|uniref:F-box protein At3g07870-like n=1 Tax=Lycium barbarum TaxID=112863 RepID=UPI00293EA04A|nr:F-box protein At3g07870-like [Lycium barbarum]